MTSIAERAATLWLGQMDRIGALAMNDNLKAFAQHPARFLGQRPIVKCVKRMVLDVVCGGKPMTDDMIPRAEADARVAAVIDWYDGLVGESTGVAGYHLNGDAAGWGEFDRPTCPDDARAALNAMLVEAEKRGEKQGMLRAAEIAWARVEGNSGRDREAAEISTAIRAEAD